MKIRVSLIAACDKKMGIGKNGDLPWKLKNEMAFFTKMTKHVTSADKTNAVIMGRKTWEAIPPKFKPLNNRLNVILSGTLQEKPDNVLLFGSLDDALKSLENNQQNIDKVWVIGGSNVYKEAMSHPSCEKVYLTQIDSDFDCDTFFPNITDNFTLLKDHGDEKDLVPTEKQEENGVFYHYRIYSNQNNV